MSGKKIIAGTFDKVVLARVQVQIQEQADGTTQTGAPGGTDPGCPSAYISLTDVVDNTQITLQVSNVSKNKVLFRNDLTITCNDRLATIEIIVPLPPMRIFLNEAGTFSFDVVWKGEILGFHRMNVVEATDQETEK
jgi:hypothetical protein